MRVVVGLGNPGIEYADTRHNLGFMVVDELALRWGTQFGKTRRGSCLARSRVGGESVVLMKPQTFMNCSGDALARLDADHRPLPSELIAVHDELDLPLGYVAIKRGGGAGGHRGLASLVNWGGPEFVRLRVGIGRSRLGQGASAHVLQASVGEQAAVGDPTHDAANAVEAVLGVGLERAMNKFNGRSAVATRTGESS